MQKKHAPVHAPVQNYDNDDDDNDLDEKDDKAFDPAALPNDHCTVLKSSFEYHGNDDDDDYTENL